MKFLSLLGVSCLMATALLGLAFVGLAMWGSRFTALVATAMFLGMLINVGFFLLLKLPAVRRRMLPK